MAYTESNKFCKGPEDESEQALIMAFTTGPIAEAVLRAKGFEPAKSSRNPYDMSDLPRIPAAYTEYTSNDAQKIRR